MTSLKDIANFVGVIALLGVMSAPLFAVLSVPGFVACLIIQRHLEGPFWLRSLAMSLALSGLLTPVLVSGHSPLFLPFPFGLWLAFHMRNYESIRGAFYGAALTLGATGCLSWRYWRREQAGSEVRGWIEPLWRGRPRIWTP